MDPINYQAYLPQADFTRNILSGLQAGSQIHQSLQASQDRERQLAQLRSYQSDITQYMQAPTAQGAAAIALKYPTQAEPIRQAWGMVDKGKRDAEMGAAIPLYSALENGAPDVAQSLLERRIKSMTNSGIDATEEQRHLELIRAGRPELVKGELGLLMAKLDPDNFTKNFVSMAESQRKQGLYPSEQAKSEADAKKATFEAGNAPVVAAQLSQKTAEEIKGLEAKRQIDLLDVQIRQANSETERGKLQLERDKLVAEQEKNKQGDQQSAQDRLDTLSQALETVTQVAGHPGLVAGTGRGGDFNAWFSGSGAADFRAMLNTVKSQQFLAGIASMKGTGQLSNEEGARIERAVAALDTSQSVPQMRTALNTVKSTLERAQAKIVASGKAASSGGTFVMKHPVYGVVREGDVNRLMSQFPGATRAQVLNYLNQTGGK